MKRKLIVGLAVAAALAPAGNAAAATLHGVVVAKQPARGAVVLALAGGRGVTVRAPLGSARIGRLVGLSAVRLHDGTMRSSRLVLGRRVRIARIHGVVVRRLPRLTLVATGRSVVAIHHGRRALASARDGGPLAPGDVADFEVRFADDELQQVAATPAGQSGSVQIEGAVVSTSPLVVSLDGLPVEIAVPAGTTLPTLAAGQRVELSVTVSPGNVFTLAALQPESPAAGEEVEVAGTVTDSSASQLTISSDGATFTFAAPTGGTLPLLAAGTAVKAEGVDVGGVLTLTELRTAGDRHGHGGGHDGGGDD